MREKYEVRGYVDWRYQVCSNLFPGKKARIKKFILENSIHPTATRKLLNSFGFIFRPRF